MSSIVEDASGSRPSAATVESVTCADDKCHGSGCGPRDRVGIPGACPSCAVFHRVRPARVCLVPLPRPRTRPGHTEHAPLRRRADEEGPAWPAERTPASEVQQAGWRSSATGGRSGSWAPARSTMQRTAGRVHARRADRGGGRAFVNDDPAVKAGRLTPHVLHGLPRRASGTGTSSGRPEARRDVPLADYQFGLLMRGPEREPRSPERLEEIQKGHMANIGRMHAAGLLVAAGPFEDGGDYRGIVVFKGIDCGGVFGAVEKDPAVRAGRLCCGCTGGKSPRASSGIESAILLLSRQPGRCGLQQGVMVVSTVTSKIHELLGAEADALLTYQAKGFDKSTLHLPGPDFVDRIVAQTDRNPQVLRNFQSIFDHGRLGGTGYVSILPVDQGIEHSAGASFAPNPIYFDPENIVKLAIEGGCNCVASTFGVLASLLAQVRPQDPVHGEDQPQRVPELPEQVRPGDVRQRRAGLRARRGRRRRDDLLRVRRVDAAAAGSGGGVPARPRTRHGDGAVVLPAEPRLQDGREGLPHVGRPVEPGQSPRRARSSRTSSSRSCPPTTAGTRR